ncbi:unnamed protein product (macronuclear) [Paramecium tetraurelia]|uniref:EF-hand domain-containing protein n=1 Tax=Paramecium tetraurelia TaxID=5888 RepID=A0EAZ9_PARTE|nr:uncharacterized protein GSPATT00025200001 [Paramecium tetraurelia]CAK92466.1 unnamed protein product [Paramecium tetraurelia]|eukprot:XP_001459863.1 hypothetical protein (macronuclear) [Paramecium tetraurelia strain d4-2]
MIISISIQEMGVLKVNLKFFNFYPIQQISCKVVMCSTFSEARLQVARRIFKMLDSENNGFITEKHFILLLMETYNNMGMKIEPTRENVEMWMEIADQDRDGKVYLIDCEALVLKSLRSQGIEID